MKSTGAPIMIKPTFSPWPSHRALPDASQRLVVLIDWHKIVHHNVPELAINVELDGVGATIGWFLAGTEQGLKKIKNGYMVGSRTGDDESRSLTSKKLVRYKRPLKPG